MPEGQSLREKPPLIQSSKLPIYGNLIKYFDRSVGVVGLHEASIKFLAKFGCKINVSYEDPQTQEILKEKPTLVIAAHNRTTTETLPFVASLPRNDTYIAGNACFLDWGESFKDFVLPLYESHKSVRGLSAKLLTITEFESGSSNPFENYEKNKPKMEEIVKKINEGHLVIAYPTGNRVGQKPRVGIWHNGIGRIILDLQNPTDSYIVMAKASELHPRPSITNKKLSLFGININYSVPIKVSDFLSQFGPEDHRSGKITRTLEKKYYGF